jgi:hypothetical protein
MTYIAVSNNGGDNFSAKYDGIQYEFPAGGKTLVPIDAARHIFGLGNADKKSVMARHGWLAHSIGLDAAHAKLNSFSFGAHKDDEPPIPDDVQEEIAEPEIISFGTEQRSAPLLTEAGGNKDSDGSDVPPVTDNSPAGKVADAPNLGKTISLKKK